MIRYLRKRKRRLPSSHVRITRFGIAWAVHQRKPPIYRQQIVAMAIPESVSDIFNFDFPFSSVNFKRQGGVRFYENVPLFIGL
jgi:hypothetical protein